jgi:aspartate 1-decarboxylase
MSVLKDKYERTVWEDNKTRVTADRLNNIERGISRLHDAALTSADIEGSDSVEVKTTDTGKVKILMKATVAIITEEQSSYDPDVIYFLLSENGIIRKIIINGVSSNYVVGH